MSTVGSLPALRLTDSQRLRQQWLDVLTQTWLDARAAVLSRTLWRVPVVVMSREGYEEELRNAIDLGVEAHRLGLVSAPRGSGD